MDSSQKYKQFIRFCIVGLACTGLDAAIFFFVRMFVPYQIALISGYLISLCVNYLLTIFWTFNTKPNVANVIGVVSAHLFNLFVVRMGLMWMFVSKMDLSDQVAYVPTLVISVVVNFCLIKFVIIKTKNE